LLSQVPVERIAPADKACAVMRWRKRFYTELNRHREEAINFLCALAARSIAGERAGGSSSNEAKRCCFPID
jgi:hypothetical protein